MRLKVHQYLPEERLTGRVPIVQGSLGGVPAVHHFRALNKWGLARRAWDAPKSLFFTNFSSHNMFYSF